MSNTTWTNDGTNVERVDIPAAETECGKDTDLLVSHEFDSWFDAMYTCKKLSPAGYVNSDFETIEEYALFFEEVKKHKGSTILSCNYTF